MNTKHASHFSWILSINNVYRGYQEKLSSIMDTKHKQRLLWMSDINIVYHGYKIQMLYTMDTQKLILLEVNTRHKTYHGYQTLLLCIIDTRNGYTLHTHCVSLISCKSVIVDTRKKYNTSRIPYTYTVYRRYQERIYYA